MTNAKPDTSTSSNTFAEPTEQSQEQPQKQPKASQSYSDFLKQDFNQLFQVLEGLEPRQVKFLQSRWLDQVLYMEKKAGQCRDNYYRMRLTTILGGVITPILVSLNTGDMNPALKGLLSVTTIITGGLVAGSAAIEEFFHYGERWHHFRRGAESLKSIGWQFTQLSGPYRRFKTHGEGFIMFTDQIEEVIRQDVEQFSTQQTQQLEEQQQSQSNPSPTEGGIKSSV